MNREQRISKAWADEADRFDKLEAFCRKLVGVSSILCRRANTIRIADDERNRRRFAKALIDTEAALSDARKAGIIK